MEWTFKTMIFISNLKKKIGFYKKNYVKKNEQKRHDQELLFLCFRSFWPLMVLERFEIDFFYRLALVTTNHLWSGLRNTLKIKMIINMHGFKIHSKILLCISTGEESLVELSCDKILKAKAGSMELTKF